MALIRSSRRRGVPDRLLWWHVLAISLFASLFAGLLVYYGRPGTFRASSSILLDEGPDVVQAVSGAAKENDAAAEKEMLLTILSSYEIRSRLANRYNLAERMRLAPDEAVAVLGRMTSVEQIGGGLSLEVRCRGYRAPWMAFWGPLAWNDARELSAALANDYVAELEDYLAKTRVKKAQDDRKFVAEARGKVQKQLDETETRLLELQSQYALLDPDRKAEQTVARLTAAQTTYDAAVVSLDEASCSLGEARSRLGKTENLRVGNIVEMRNPMIAQLEAKLADLRVELAAEKAKGKSSLHRDVAQVQSSISDVEKQLTELKARIQGEVSLVSNSTYDSLTGKVADLHISVAASRARKARSAVLLSQAKAAMSELPTVAREYTELKRQQEVQSQLIVSLDQSLAMAMIQEQKAEKASQFSKLDVAVPPILHGGPPTVLVGGIVFILFFGVLSLFMVDRRALGMF